mmetsp:Transcript_70102/g.160718  ORF Transcript_70102/g.160718 Transcript_70102/m.160718 type:complete len:943 (+) Transcript_70102:533-3361(+)
MELDSSSGATTSLHRAILNILRTEMAKGTTNSNGLTIATIKKRLVNANAASHQSASTAQISAALQSMTLWGKNAATVTQSGTKFKATSKENARTASPSPSPVFGPSLMTASPTTGQASRDEHPRSNNASGTPGIDAMLLDSAAPEESTPTTVESNHSGGAANAEPLVASKETTELIRKQQLSLHDQATSTLELFNVADGMSANPDGTPLQTTSTQRAKTVFDKFATTLRTMVNTKIFSDEQELTLTSATTAIQEVLRELVLVGLDTSALTSCPFCLNTTASMTHEHPVDLAARVEHTPYDRHLATCEGFILLAPSLQLETLRVGSYVHPPGTRPGATIQQCIDALRTHTIKVHGTDPVKWPRTFDNLHIDILAAVNIVTDAQRQHVNYFHRHWSANPTQEGLEALVSQITTETNTLEALPGGGLPGDTVDSAPIDAPPKLEKRPSRSPARSRSPRTRSRGSSLRSTTRSRSLSRTPRGEGSKQHTTRRSTSPRPRSVKWETFNGDASPSPPPKRPRNSASDDRASEPSPRNEPPSGGPAPRKAHLGTTSSSSTAAMAVLKVMRDNDNTAPSASSEAYIMAEVAKVYPEVSPSALSRATKDLISKNLLTMSLEQDIRHLHLAPVPEKALSKSSDTTTDGTQHNTRAIILDFVAKSRKTLGLDFAELWTLYEAAVPAPDQIKYHDEFQRLLDQKVLVPPEGSPPGTRRFIMKADYDHRTDLMGTLPPSKVTTGASSTSSRLTGSPRIPRISDAPPPAARYTVAPTEEQRAAMATHIIKTIKADASSSMAGISSKNVEALLARTFGDRTSSADVINLINNMVATYRITSWTSRSGALMVGPFHAGGKTPQAIPRIKVDANATIPDHITRLVVYESLHTLAPGVRGLSEFNILRVVDVKLDRTTDPASISRALAALLDDEHISILLDIASADAPPIYSPYGMLVTD